MPTTDLDIVNRALSRLGTTRISAMAEDTKNGRACNAAWPFVRDEILRKHPWDSVCTRTQLAPYRASTVAINAVSQTNPAVITTASDPSFQTGDVVAISGAAGMTQLNNREFSVVRLTGTTYQLQGEDSSAYPAYSGSGIVGKPTEPLFEWEREYPLPATALRVLECYRVEDWVVEKSTTGSTRSVFTDQHAPLSIRFLNQELDEAIFDALLFSLLAARLAIELAPELTDPSSGKLAEMQAWYRELLDEAGMVESQEQTPTELEEDDWILARE